MQFLKSLALAFITISLVVVNFLTTVSPVAAETFEVKMGTDKGQLAFEPKVITIKAGDTVRWINNKAYPHNVVFQDETLSHAKLLVKPKQSVETTFSAAGEFNYYCTPHRGAGMLGKVVVQ